MQHVFTCILLVLCFSANCQKKKEKFYNENGDEISKEKFISSINYAINIDAYVRNDSLTLGRLYTRIIFDKLSSNNLKSLRNYLTEISGQQNDSSKVIVINYFPGEEDIEKGKSQASIYKKEYLKEIEKAGNIQQYWIYKSTSNLKHQHGDRLKWIHDKKRTIERAFFPVYFRYGSTAVIMPNGRYYIYLGEYGPRHVFGGLNQLIKNAK